jgi:hypothetical protein
MNQSAQMKKTSNISLYSFFAPPTRDLAIAIAGNLRHPLHLKRGDVRSVLTIINDDYRVSWWICAYKVVLKPLEACRAKQETNVAGAVHDANANRI